jgi:hypothetical protein
MIYHMDYRRCRSGCSSESICLGGGAGDGVACKTPARGIVKLEIEPFVLISAETAHKRNIRMDDWAAAAFWVVVGFWLVTIYNTWRFMHRKDSVACTSKDLN